MNLIFSRVSGLAQRASKLYYKEPRNQLLVILLLINDPRIMVGEKRGVDYYPPPFRVPQVFCHAGWQLD